MPLFRSKPSLPTFRWVPFLIFLVIALVVIGLVALAVIEPRPPMKHFEVPVPNERLSR